MQNNIKNTPQGVFTTTYGSVTEYATYSLELPIGFMSNLIILLFMLFVKINCGYNIYSLKVSLGNFIDLTIFSRE